MKARRSIPTGLRRQLMLEAGWKCAVIRCEHETGLDIHHIDSNPANNDYDNLIVLCAVHHRRTTSGEIDATACRTLKALLQVDRAQPGYVELSSKHEVNAALCREIERTTSFRAILSGPYFLHPEWIFARRAKNLQHDDFDQKLKRFVELHHDCADHEIRLMLTNSDRYLEKLCDLVRPNELSRFQSDLFKIIKTVWHSVAFGPDLCCIHPGFGHIVYIFDEAVITQFRAQQCGPTMGGLMWNSHVHIQREITRFDTIFDSASLGREVELEKLRSFVAALRIDEN
jgi:hypothetical protein